MRAYLELLKIPGARTLLIASAFPRLAYAMVSLAIFFLVQQASGSVAVAGLAVGVSSGIGAITAGPRGLLVDRLGQTIPLAILVPAYGLSTVALALFAHSPVTAVILAGVVGLCAPPINMSIRPLWLLLAGPERVRTAYSVDSAFTNFLQLLGPVIATFIALHVSPTAAILVVGASMTVGGLLLAGHPHSRRWVPEARDPDAERIWRSPAMRLLALEGVVMGLAVGLITIALPALATTTGHESMTGWLMAAMGVGAIVGSGWAGARAHGIAPVVGLRTSVLLFAVFCIPVAVLPIGPWMIAAIVVAWACFGPAQVFYMETIDIVRPRGTAVAALGSLWMIEGAAAAAGNALGGIIAQGPGARWALVVAAVIVFASPAIFTIGIRTVLKPAAHVTGRAVEPEPAAT